jgi:hypothetical protein
MALQKLFNDLFMRTPIKYFLLFFLGAICACSIKKKENMQNSIQNELNKIDSLLRNATYNEDMAKALDAAYYKGTGKGAPPFLAAGEDTATKQKSLKEEKIATNVAGFYALECGIGWLCSQSDQTPVEWLNKIKESTVDSATVSILNRFANATWKAGQPFRSMERIMRPTFTVFNFLPQDEVKKDEEQIATAAAKLLSAMNEVKDSSTDAQMKKIRTLMQNKDFALQMADSMNTGYNTRQNLPADKFLSAEDDTVTITKSVQEEKIAINVAGFYALECGLNYFATAKNELPSQVLQSIVDNTISVDEKMLLQRFANATWKAGQPFRGLDRTTRDNFVPFYFLTDEEIEKDWVQIKAAAEKLLKDIK